MNDSTPSNEGSLGDRLSRIPQRDNVFRELSHPLDLSRVKRRKAPTAMSKSMKLVRSTSPVRLPSTSMENCTTMLIWKMPFS